MTKEPDSSSTIEVKYFPPRLKATDMLAIARATYDHAVDSAKQVRRQTRKTLARQALKTRSRARKLGYANGKRDARMEYARRLLEIQEQANDLMREANEQCLSLSIDLAQQILGYEVANTPQYVLNQLEQALSSFTSKYQITITVHPSQLEEVRAVLLSARPDLGLTFVADQSIVSGTAKLSSIAGEVVLHWQDELKSVANELRASLTNQLKQD